MRYLIIGISFVAALFIANCGKGDVETDSLTLTTYIYKNESDHSIAFKVLDINDNIFQQYIIPANESLVIRLNGRFGKGFVPSFWYGSNDLSIGYRILINFDNNKCIQYVAYEEGLFNVRNYDNYSETMRYSNINILEYYF